jgi:FliI/YscN family ATPase
MDTSRLRAELSETVAPRVVGKVRSVTGLAVTLSVPGARCGDLVTIHRRGVPLQAEIVGFDEGETLALPLGDPNGVGPGDPVEGGTGPLRVPAHESLLGQVIDGLGRPLDSSFDCSRLPQVPLDRSPPNALERRPITEVFVTGIKVIDALMTIGVGQRIGLLAGSGVGKSRLLGAIAEAAEVDVVVVALVGERGREVREFLDHCLGPEGRLRSVVVVATSDAPAIMRLKSVQTATSIAEYFRDQGKKALLLVDSLTRVARAQREVGLLSGEPPVRRGYPPSVFGLLPRLLERSGQSARGSITALYTVLVEGDDFDEPIADEARAILDGQIVLSRALAERGHYPAVDVGASLSRVMDRITSREQQHAARRLRSLIAAYEERRDMIALGAYVPGSDRRVDQAIERWDRVTAFLQQRLGQVAAFSETSASLETLTRALDP